ncbi:coiled-coil domain-containing protein 60 isoform X1 [Macaca nemestrina]|uniref:Coiled-coil domain containing 60 n=2 Tax=Macaca nemestrina TaxID=9545 RepID=A0A2K6BSI2_MACNE|nr:coiled-coil domain-containing protein 60 isoform X2 [Macaca nemestrina]XP_050603973.1 coiled-coil domain-containing protein 60 isoform X1 [Macaca thibetana thibetana]
MTKVPATKKLQSSPNAGAVRPFYASENLRQVPDKPMKSIKYMDKEIINLKKDLIRSRFLIQSVKIGRGYFAILREETAKKKKQQQLQKLKEEERNKFQPAEKISEIQYGDTLLSTYDDEKLKMLGARVTRRPFTPVHSCIISPSLPEAHVEPLFRQLCALHWLLEALTIDHTHHTMKPVITCWNPKDPGGSKSTIKKINKDKSMGQKWEHFVTAPKTKKFKIPTMRVTNRKPSRRGSTLSLSRASGGSSPQSSMISVNPGSDEPPSVNTQVTSSKDIEDNESSSTKPDEEPLSMNLQKLLEMVREDARRTITIENGMQRKAPSLLSVLKQNKSNSAYKEMQTTHKSSERSSSTSAESHIQPVQKKSKNRTNCDINIQYKSGVCNSMRAKFYSVAQEAGFCLQDKMEILMKRQEERGIQKFRAFVLVSNFQKDIAKMRHHISVVKGDAEEIADHWYFDLLSKLPEDLKNFRPAKKILVKLQKFGENLDLRIRPHVLLKVLQDLRIWELCSPDIAVAIEFVREHIIHMPQEDYINWLQSRINIPIGPYSALR